MKKFVKIFAVIAIVCIGFIVAIPLLFEDKIINLVKETANNNINATLDFKEGDLSLWSNFPNLEISLEGTSLVNNAPFEGDTLFSAKTVDLKLPFAELFKSEGIRISNFVIDEAFVSIEIDDQGKANYDIAKKKDSEINETADTANAMQFDLASYEIRNSTISYNDASSKMSMYLSGLNHSGTGNLSSEKSELKTTTSTQISFEKDSVVYLKNNTIKLDAVFGIDLLENKYTFLDNKVVINQLPLVFEGYIQQNENDQQLDISFSTPSSDFKNFLALIPEVYSKNIEGVTTTGTFEVNGKIEGRVDENHIPKLDISIRSDNASFKYPDLPKSLDNININTEIINKTGLSKDTYVAINKLSFKIDNQVFNANAKLTEVTKNMKVAANVKGKVNLGSLEEIYPADGVKGLKGILGIDANTNFDMQSVENKQYEKTKISGNFNLTDFEYNSDEFSNPVKVSKATISLSPQKVNLNSFDAQLGSTDFSIAGTLKNFLGFLFNKENIEGRFNLVSNTFSVNDFMTSKEENQENSETETSEEQLKIPSFLDCTIDAKATTVLYDNVTLKNVTGILIIKDERAELKNMRSNVFDGALGFNGSVSTKEETPTFQMDLDVNSFDIGKSFSSLELFKTLAPIANTIKGKINSKVTLSGNLNNDFTPNLNSISGDLLAELLSSKITTEQSPLLQSLEQNLSFIDTKKLNLDNLKTALSFKDGKVALKPFMLHYEDIEIAVSGSHGFDTSLDYDAVVNVPAKYLGKEASGLIAQLNDNELNNIKVPVSALISGKFNNPSIKTDLKSAVSNLGKQIAANQKEKLVNQGKEKVTNALSELLKGKQKDSVAVDTTKKDVTKEAAKNLLQGLFKKRTKKKKDTVD